MNKFNQIASGAWAWARATILTGLTVFAGAVSTPSALAQESEHSAKPIPTSVITTYSIEQYWTDSTFRKRWHSKVEPTLIPNTDGSCLRFPDYQAIGTAYITICGGILEVKVHQEPVSKNQ